MSFLETWQYGDRSKICALGRASSCGEEQNSRVLPSWSVRQPCRRLLNSLSSHSRGSGPGP
eukprot:7828815-Alexandrium_andersonii.AAC.1